MRYPPHLLDDIRARLPVSAVVARKVALKKAGREWKGLSPFKVEKTPSFYVNDQKGFYKCFSSGEFGDIFTFVMKTEGLSFPEAVERLAAEAGVSLPRPEREDPKAAERADERGRLYDLLAAACRFFEERLKAPEGQEARRYIERRGLKRETITTFGMGFAPAGRSALKEHLASMGFTPAEMATSGMLIAGDDIAVPYDRFRNRVMFPIADLKGRIIAFGGRALDPSAPAKYLNSPETPIFHKGSILFNAHRARPLAFDRGRVIVVEGYMDAIALAEAGMGETVAPLGTALTEAQVELVWRMAPEPVLCFDGDSAGLKAAYRAVDTVLPHLKPGVSVSFAFLPDGLDPDDLVRQGGPEAMAAVLDRKRPLVDVLWEREWSQGQWATPERRAKLERQLWGLVQRIADAGVRGHYERDVRSRLAAAWGDTRAGNAGRERYARPRMGSQAPTGTPGGMARGPGTGFLGRSNMPRGSNRPGAFLPPPAASQSLKASRLVQGTEARPAYREALILLTLLNHPWLIEERAEELAALTLTSPALERLREAMLATQVEEKSLDRKALSSHLTQLGLAKVVALVERAITHKGDKFAEPEADRAAVDSGWRHAVGLHQKQVGLKLALAAAEQAWHEEGSEVALARLCEIRSLLNGVDGTEAA